MNNRRYFKPIFVGLFFLTSLVFADQMGWWERFMPGRTPQILQDAPYKPPVQPHPEAIGLQNSFAQVVEVIKPAVVNISAVHITKVKNDSEEFFFGDPNEFFYRFFGDPGRPGQQAPMRPRQREYRSEGAGSGVFIDPDGYILTNNHVVQGADQLTVLLSNGKSLKGTVVGTDARTDLAIIRVKGSHSFPYAPLGDSAAMRVGDWVLAFGSPFGLQQTVTSGIVSAIRQSLVIEGKTFANLIQTDAAINRGNSGGPLVNLKGEVIGVNTAIYAPTGVFSGIGFAIPANEAKKILSDLIKKGYVERSWMGVEIAELDDVMAQQFRLESKEGALINQVVPGSPAEKAGLERGDVVVAINGKKIKTVNELQEWVGQTPPKTVIQIKIIRSGSPKVVKLTTEPMPHQQKEEGRKEKSEPKDNADTVSWLGATFSTITPRLKESYEIEGRSMPGVVVVNLPQESVAAEAGLSEGDVIREVNRNKIESIEDLKAIKGKMDAKKGLVFDVVRQGKSFYLSFKSLQ